MVCLYLRRDQPVKGKLRQLAESPGRTTPRVHKALVNQNIGIHIYSAVRKLALIRKYAFLAEGRNDCQDSAKMGFSSDPTRVFTAPRGAFKT